METIDLSFIPPEIIELILQSGSLTVGDLCNFGSTCTAFWSLVHKSNQIWKTKFYQMWPNLLKHESYKKHKVLKWEEEFRIRWSVREYARQLLNTMSARHIKHEWLSASDFKPFDDTLCTINHKFGLQFMIDELMLYIHHTNRNINLTKKYYSEKAIRYLRQTELTPKWQDFKNASPEEQLLEKGAVILAQWTQPAEEISYQSIESQLNAISEKVIEQIRFDYGDKHASLEVPAEMRSHWSGHNLVDNHFSPHISRQVINAVSTVLFKEMGFNGNNDLYCSPENSCINKVLEHRRGIPITFAILFESVSRRLGIKCETVGFPGHFLLRWRDTYRENVPSQCFYIDMCNGGTFLDRNSCPQFSNRQSRCPMGDIARFAPATAVQVMEKLASCLEVAGRQCTSMNGRALRLQSALELLHLIAPANLNCLIQLARFYMQHNMDVSALRQELLDIRHFNLRDMGQASYIMSALKDYDEDYRQHNRGSCDEPNIQVKARTGGQVDVQFAVGMVLHHRHYNYTCVVVGWDQQCAASTEWMMQMNIKALSRQHQQPFYHVLVSDGTNRYAAEENLEMESNADLWVTHCDVGRYFDSFCDTHYLPNTELSRAYPEDFTVLQQRLGLLQHTQ